jgi:hypothetical protein
MISTTMPMTSTVMVLCVHPFHSFKIIPHTLLNVTLRAIRIHQEKVISAGDRSEEPFSKAESEELAVP